MSAIAYMVGTQVNLSIPLVKDGVQLSAQSVQYRILNQSETELVPKTTVSDFVPDSPNVNIAVDASVNQINTTDTQEIRLVELYVTDATGQIKIAHNYIIEKESVLVEGVNSFQNHPTSLLVASTLSKVEAYLSASKQVQVAAMQEAWRAFSHVTLRKAYYDDYMSQIDTNVGYRDITRISPEVFAAISSDLKSALRRAQVLQANFLLTDDETENMRNEGVIEFKVGEAKKVFMPTIKYKGVLDKRAMRELSLWIEHGMRTSR